MTKITIKIEEKTKRNIENIFKKKQNRKRKAVLISIDAPSEKKKKELLLFQKANMINN